MPKDPILSALESAPESPDMGQIARISLKNWKSHLKSVNALEAKIVAMMDEAIKSAAQLGRRIKPEDIGRAFEKNPTLRSAIADKMRELAADLTAVIEQGSKDAWMRSNTCASQVVESMAMDNEELKKLLDADIPKRQNDRALEAFLQRQVDGMKLSDRVWKVVDGANRDIERAIEVSLAEGTPAQNLSRRVRDLLLEPSRLYRRVRDENGNLRLSAAARKYNPGRGVYRSSYKNAMRLARTEVNIAYHSADNERWSKSWWVRGIRIGLSNNHTVRDSKGRVVPLYDVCDELKGDYPSDFKFVGWHPHCRCISTALTVDYSEIRSYYKRKRAGEDMSDYSPSGVIKETPKAFTDWVKANKTRLEKSVKGGAAPYFIRDNGKYAGEVLSVKKRKGPRYGSAMKKGRNDRNEAYEAYRDAPPPVLSDEQTAQIEKLAKELGIEVTPMTPNEAAGKSNVVRGKTNCQSCVVAHEARLRGLNVTAVNYVADEDHATYIIGERFQDAFVSPKTGKVVEPTKIRDKDYSQMISKLERQMSSPGRYIVGTNNDKGGDGHVIIAERLSNGAIIYYDPQKNDSPDIATKYQDVEYFEVLKIDKLLFNEKYFTDVVKTI